MCFSFGFFSFVGLFEIAYFTITIRNTVNDDRIKSPTMTLAHHKTQIIICYCRYYRSLGGFDPPCVGVLGQFCKAQYIYIYTNKARKSSQCAVTSKISDLGIPHTYKMKINIRFSVYTQNI